MTQKPKLFYGWIIVFLAFMSITTYGLFYSYSLFLEPLENALQSSRAPISAVYTTYMVVYSICAILMGSLSDRFGPQKTIWLAAFLIGGGISLCSLTTSIWQLYLFFGVMGALGHSAIWVVPTSTINRWFIQKRGLAVGIAVSGVGVGLFVVPPITAQIINRYSWQVAFIVLGITFFTINGIAGLFMRGRPEDKGLRPLGEVEQEASISNNASNIIDFSVTDTIKTKAFWMIYMVPLFCFGAEQMVLVHIVPYSTAIGISATQASLGLSFLGVGTILGRLTSGVVLDKIGAVHTLVVCCIIEAAAIFCLLAVNSPVTLYLTMLLLGFGYGGWAVSCAVILADFFGTKNLGTILGIWFTCGAPAGILGPLMGGVVFDLTKSYFLAVIFAGIICIVAVILATLIKPPHTRVLDSSSEG